MLMTSLKYRNKDFDSIQYLFFFLEMLCKESCVCVVNFNTLNIKNKTFVDIRDQVY